MPVSGVSLADANFWLAVAFDDHLHHAKAKEWFGAQLDESCAFCRITQMALPRHLTNSKIMTKFVQSQREAWQTYECLINDPRVIFLPEPAGIDASFRRLTLTASPAHEHWTDAYLAAFALSARAQFVTFDRGFKWFDGLDLRLLE